MKYYGKIGFAEDIETSPDVWTSNIIERDYRGDVLEGYGRSINLGSAINPSLTLSNKISIVADPYAISHYFNMKYIVWEGAKWLVSNVSFAYPRLILSLGGLYVEEQTGTP